MPSLALLQRYLWVSNRKLTETSLVYAQQLLLSKDPTDIHTALQLLEVTLKAFPQCEKAIELKARALLCLRRFRDIVSLLQESVPSLKAHPPSVEVSSEDKIELLPSHLNHPRTRKVSFSQCFSLVRLRRCVLIGYGKKGDREQWKYIVLGQACCHLGMMEDAMILLSNGKKAASAAHRKQSSRCDEDSFVLDGSHVAADATTVSHLLGNIKLLLRRRTAALAALDAGLYTEAARHFSKIIEGRRGTPQGFVAECYMHRATAHQAANQIVDALADCNKCLTLNPMSAEALSTRASLYEMIGCLSDSIEDLASLKALYETIAANNMQWVHTQSLSNPDLQGCIDFINSQIASMIERVNGHGIVDHHRILGLSRGCSRAEVDRAYLLLSLKHRPDKAAHFIDRCEFVDERDIEVVKGEARAVGLKLFKLLQKAYTWVMSSVLEDEMSRVRHIHMEGGAPVELSKEGSLLWPWEGLCPSEYRLQAGTKSQLAENASFGVDPLGNNGSPHDEASPRATSFKYDYLQVHNESDDFPTMDALSNVGQLVDATLFAQVTTCREVANVGPMHPQGLPSEAWMSPNVEWGHSVHALSVT